MTVLVEGMMKVSDLVQELDAYCVWGYERTVTKPSPIDRADPDSLAFYAKGKEQALQVIRDSKAGVIVCSNEIEYPEFEDKTLILVPDPRLAFGRILKLFQVEKLGIHRSVVIYDRVKIGKNVIIHAGAVIGAQGFSYNRNERGELERVPQLAGVTIEDDVEIGANTCIDCGTMDDTIIGQGTKIDNLVHIAHNVKIGKHCIIVAETFIGGSVEIGDYTWIAPQVCVRDWVNIGSNVVVGMGSVVTKTVGDNVVVMGVPAGLQLAVPRPPPPPSPLDASAPAAILGRHRFRLGRVFPRLERSPQCRSYQ